MEPWTELTDSDCLTTSAKPGGKTFRIFVLLNLELMEFRDRIDIGRGDVGWNRNIVSNGRESSKE
jgi:hypothetical protein